jgi:glyoxylate utilization-related uncharacterized protein
MPLIHRLSEIELKENNSPIPHFSWKSSLPLEEISKSKYLHFDIKSLFPGKFSYPYHFHRNAEELFIILEGEATLRSPEGYQTISKGDIIFFELDIFEEGSKVSYYTGEEGVRDKWPEELLKKNK